MDHNDIFGHKYCIVNQNSFIFSVDHNDILAISSASILAYFNKFETLFSYPKKSILNLSLP